MRAWTFAWVSTAIVFGCASQKIGRTELPDGSYQLSCQKPLADCLALISDVCDTHGFDVVRAKEERKRYGVEPVQSEIITSEAIVRCRSAGALIGGDSASAAPKAGAAPVAHVARCFPGSTMACLGPGACKGAQTCREDGGMFGPCDCGGASVVATPEADAGPPPTWATDGGAP